jgi:hypothetical protein
LSSSLVGGVRRGEALSGVVESAGLVGSVRRGQVPSGMVKALAGSVSPGSDGR